MRPLCSSLRPHREAHLSRQASPVPSFFSGSSLLPLHRVLQQRLHPSPFPQVLVLLRSHPATSMPPQPRLHDMSKCALVASNEPHFGQVQPLLVHRLGARSRHTSCPWSQNLPWKMSPKEPPPIFLESRYFLPTRSSILAFTNGEATLRCATAACGAAEHKVVSHGRTQRIWAPASNMYCHGEHHDSLGFEARCGAGTTARAASRLCCAPRAAGRAASTQH